MYGPLNYNRIKSFDHIVIIIHSIMEKQSGLMLWYKQDTNCTFHVYITRVQYFAYARIVAINTIQSYKIFIQYFFI